MSGGDVLVLDRDEVRALLDLDELRVALATAFEAVSAGRVSAPPRIAARAGDEGLVAAMPAWVPGWGFAVKLVSVFPGNLGGLLPSHQGVLVVFDDGDGRPVAVMDAAEITEVRTAATSALAADLLARPDAAVLAVVGAGATARSHLRAFAGVRPWLDVRVASRSPERAGTVAGESGARAVASIEEAVAGADVVALCTDAAEPVVLREWIGAGCHVGSIGFRGEIGPDLVEDASVFVEWRGAVTNPHQAGALELQGVDPATVTELGEVLSGARPGRVRPDELTLYKSTGVAVEDAAAAHVVLTAARAAGAGREVALW